MSEEDVQNGLKQVMRVYPQGVTVLATASDKGPKGLTVSSFTSVSLAPPLVLVSVARGSALHDLFRGAKSFSINFLADDQKSVSDRFAGRVQVKDRFDGIKHTAGITGSPVISGARAVIECEAWHAYEGGDHTLLVGRVVAARPLNTKKPLVYYTQQYTTTEPIEYPAPPSDFVW